MIFSLGEILGVASDSVMQLIPEAVSTLIKITRTSSFDPGLRAIALDSTRKIFVKHERIKDESTTKDIIKVARFGLSDKYNIVQIRAAQVKRCLIKVAYFNSSYKMYQQKLTSCHLNPIWTTSKHCSSRPSTRPPGKYVLQPVSV